MELLPLCFGPSLWPHTVASGPITRVVQDSSKTRLERHLLSPCCTGCWAQQVRNLDEVDYSFANVIARGLQKYPLFTLSTLSELSEKLDYNGILTQIFFITTVPCMSLSLSTRRYTILIFLATKMTLSLYVPRKEEPHTQTNQSIWLSLVWSTTQCLSLTRPSARQVDHFNYLSKNTTGEDQIEKGKQSHPQPKQTNAFPCIHNYYSTEISNP